MGCSFPGFGELIGLQVVEPELSLEAWLLRAPCVSWIPHVQSDQEVKQFETVRMTRSEGKVSEPGSYVYEVMRPTDCGS